MLELPLPIPKTQASFPPHAQHSAFLAAMRVCNPDRSLPEPTADTQPRSPNQWLLSRSAMICHCFIWCGAENCRTPQNNRQSINLPCESANCSTGNNYAHRTRHLPQRCAHSVTRRIFSVAERELSRDRTQGAESPRDWLSHVGRRSQRKRRRRFNRSVVQQKRLSSFVALGGLGNPSSSESRGDSVIPDEAASFPPLPCFSRPAATESLRA